MQRMSEWREGLCRGFAVGTEASGADVDPLLSAVNSEFDAMSIGLPRPLGVEFGMAHVVAELASFAAEFTPSWQSVHSLRCCQKRLRGNFPLLACHFDGKMQRI